MRRFLLHVLPSGFHRIRHYGLLANAGRREHLAPARRLLHVVDGESNRILGGTILGVGGDEAVHSIVDVMALDAPFTALQQAVHIHPTVAELLPTLLGELKALE